MFEKIIVATDLSSTAFAVVRDLSGMRAFGAKKCLLLECLSLPQVGSVGLYYTYSVLEKSLKEQADLLEKQGFDVETRVIFGLSKSEVMKAAEEENYSMIVVGAQITSLVNEALIGGIAYEMIHHVRKPILISRLAEFMEGPEVGIHPVRTDYGASILHPTDFSDTAEQAFRMLKELVRNGARKVTLMHVQDKTKIEPYLEDRLKEFNEIDTSRLRKMKEELEATGPVKVDVILSYGNPSKEIIDFIHTESVNLVVMGSQGRGYVKDLFIGSVSHNVARHSEASVLLVPASSDISN